MIDGAKLLKVTWIDAAWSSGIHSPQELRDFMPATLTSIGWGFISESGVHIAGEGNVEDKEFRHCQVIPKGCVVSCLELDEHSNVKEVEI